MADEVVDIEEDEEESTRAENIRALVGWGIIAIGTVVFVWRIFTQLGVGWSGKDQDALDLVRSFQAPGMAHNLADQTIALGEAAREKGSFVGQFAWSARQDDAAIYNVELIWKEGSSTKKATWRVDLEDESIRPIGPDAGAFMKKIE